MMRNKILMMFFMMLSCVSTAQETLSGQVSEIKDDNKFILTTKENIEYKIILEDTEPLDSKKISSVAREYLREKILGKEVILVDVKIKSDNTITASVIYNCKTYKSIDYSNEEIPCSEGNVLNVEMLKAKLLEYTGSNKFLKQISEN